MKIHRYVWLWEKDALDAIADKLESVKTELDAWREVSTNTAYEGATVGAIGG